MADDIVCKNSGKILCEKCGSVILLPNAATWIEVEDGIFLPPMKKSDGEGEKAFTFWTVSDMFDFENVGFCNTTDNVKYLACADCEIGPIGAHLLNDKTKFYISPLRVKHVDLNGDVIKANKGPHSTKQAAMNNKQVEAQ